MHLKENNHVKQLTFHETSILNDSSLLMIFSLCVYVYPHHFQMNLGYLFPCQKNVLCHCGLQICASWRTSLWIHVFLPVLRRSWFFQENSATKRVSMGIRRQKMISCDATLVTLGAWLNHEWWLFYLMPPTIQSCKCTLSFFPLFPPPHFLKDF